MNRLGLEAGGFGEALRRAARRGAEEALHFFGAQEGEDGIHQCGFADARPTGDHQHTRAKGLAQRFGLAGRQIDGLFFLQPFDGLVGVDMRIVRLEPRHSSQACGDLHLRPSDSREKNQILAGDGVFDQFALGKHFRQCALQDEEIQFQEACRIFEEGFFGKSTVPFASGLEERVGESRTATEDRVLGNAELAGDVISGFKADSRDIACEEIGVGAHFFHRLISVGLVDPHRPTGADSIGVQKNHDLAHDLLLGPRHADRASPLRADPSHLLQPHGLAVDDIEDTLAEFLHELFGIDRANAFDEAAREVFFNPFARCWSACLKDFRLELGAVIAVLYPSAFGSEPFAGIDARGAANNGRQIASSIDLHPHHTKSRLLVVESDPLD